MQVRITSFLAFLLFLNALPRFVFHRRSRCFALTRIATRFGTYTLKQHNPSLDPPPTRVPPTFDLDSALFVSSLTSAVLRPKIGSAERGGRLASHWPITC